MFIAIPSMGEHKVRFYLSGQGIRLAVSRDARSRSPGLHERKIPPKTLTIIKHQHYQQLRIRY